MTSYLEILALIFIVLAIVKILALLIRPKFWLRVVKKVWFDAGLMMALCFVLAIIVLGFLLVSGITITQILAIMLFTCLLAGIGVAAYSKEVVEVAEKLLRNRNIVKKSWLYLIIWIALLAWGLKELFM